MRPPHAESTLTGRVPGAGVEAAARGKHPTVMAERAPRGRGLKPPHAESTLTGRVPGGLRPPPHAEDGHHPYI